MAQLLQSDKLMMDELEVLAAVREWATVNSVRHKRFRQWHPTTIVGKYLFGRRFEI